MKKKALFLIIFSVISIIFTLSAASCGEKVDMDEVKAALSELLPKSEELNVIYFGEGLPISDDREQVEKFYNSFDSDIKAINYHPVAEDCGYSNETDIRNATLEVFTENYSEYLFERAFKGISAVLNEGSEDEHTVTATYALYIEMDGILTVRMDMGDEAMELGREYDVSGAELVSCRGGVVTVSVPSTMNGVASDIELRLVKTENGWRLDSPTY